MKSVLGLILLFICSNLMFALKDMRQLSVTKEVMTGAFEPHNSRRQKNYAKILMNKTYDACKTNDLWKKNNKNKFAAFTNIIEHDNDWQITKVEMQVVAGENYRIFLQRQKNGHTQSAEVGIFQPLPFTHKPPELKSVDVKTNHN